MRRACQLTALALRNLAGALPAAASEPVLFLLDECAALGRMPPLKRAVGLMAGYGMQVWTIFQDLHQLRAIYGKAAGTFLSNAGIVQAFNVNDLETARWISSMLGADTEVYGGGAGRDGSRVARPLLTPVSWPARGTDTPNGQLAPWLLSAFSCIFHPPDIANKRSGYADVLCPDMEVVRKALAYIRVQARRDELQVRLYALQNQHHKGRDDQIAHGPVRVLRTIRPRPKAAGLAGCTVARHRPARTRVGIGGSIFGRADGIYRRCGRGGFPRADAR